MERDPADNSLKITITPPDCILMRKVDGIDVQDRRLKVRLRGEVGSTTAAAAKLFAMSAAIWMDNGSQAIGATWQPRSFLFRSPGAPAGFDLANITAVGISFEGSNSTVWLEDLELVREPADGPLPSYEFNDAMDELTVKPAGVISSSSEITWDLGSVRNLQFTREWGIQLSSAKDDIEPDVDWIRFEE